MVTLEQFRYCPTHSTHPPFCYDFHYVKPGMVAIFGDNGSGKSTLAMFRWRAGIRTFCRER